MTDFKKVYNIIFFTISMVFLLNVSLYSYPMEGILRVPSSFKNPELEKRIEGTTDEFGTDSEVIAKLGEVYEEWEREGYLFDTTRKFKLLGLLGQLLTDENGNGIIIVGGSGMGKTLISAEIFKRFKRSKFIVDDFIILSIIDGKIYAGYDPMMRRAEEGNFREIDYRSKGSELKDILYEIPEEQTHADFVRIRKIVTISAEGIERERIETEISNSDKAVDRIKQHLWTGRFWETDINEALLSQNLSNVTVTDIVLPENRDKRFLELDKIIKAIMSNEHGGSILSAILSINMEHRDVDSGI